MSISSLSSVENFSFTKVNSKPSSFTCLEILILFSNTVFFCFKMSISSLSSVENYSFFTLLYILSFRLERKDEVKLILLITPN